jgi:hypothetical protein
MSTGTPPDPRGNGNATGLGGASQGSIEVRDAKTHVVYSRPMFFDVSSDRRIRSCGLEQFDPSGPVAEEGHADFLGGNFFGA